MKSGISLLLVSLFMGSGVAFSQTSPAVPAAYQNLYAELQGDVSAFSQAISASWNGSHYPTVFSSQLLTANSDQGPSLLGSNYYTGTVLPELQEMQALGVTAVSVHINFPILYQPYYTNAQDFQSYVAFYQQLAQQIRASGMKLTVETTVASAGAGSNGGVYAPYYSTLSWSDYVAGRAQNAVNVAQLIQPDYMSVITEPDSESQNSGQPNAGTPAGSLQELQTILAALQVANVTNVAVGAGAGTWISSFSTYIQNVISTPVSFVDLHIYSVSNAFPENALAAAGMAHAANLPIAVSETWCKKISAAQLQGASGALNNEAVDALGTFSFWEPLDQMYLQTLVNMSQAGQFMFIAPFWTSLYYSYLDYGQYGTQTPDQIMAASHIAAVNARQVGAFTPVGLAWETMILPSVDRTAPQVPSPPTIGQVGQTIVQLLWSPATDNVGVAGYNLYRNGTLLYTSSLINYNDNSVAPSTSYTYTLQAFDAAGNVSAMSAPATATTLAVPDRTSPSVPTGLQAAAVSDLALNISWKASTDNVAIAGYHVYRGTTANSLSIFASTPATSFTDSSSSMYPKTTFYYAVTAFDASGNSSAQSATIAATTLPDTNPPTAPTTLTAVAQGPQQVALNWSASTDDVKVVGYSISRGKTPTSMITVGTTTSTSFVDTAGLSAAQVYFYTVSAFDEASNYSPASPMATLTTLPVTTPPTVSLQTSVSPSAIGQTVTFTATVRLISGTIPNGETVVFLAGSTQIGSGSTNGGVATFSTASLAVGSNLVTATYPGDGVYQAATSLAVNQVVSRNATTATVTTSANPTSYGQSVTFTALVSSTGTVPTGSVTFRNGATPIGSSTLVNGVATFSTSTLSTGTNSITVLYGGDPSSLTSTSSSLSQIVNAATITLALNSSANPSTPNQQVTFTGTLTIPNGGIPTGTITFSQSGSVIGSPITVTSRQASISTSFAATGTYQITAVYSGDINFTAAIAPAFSQIIAAASTTTSVKSSGSPTPVGTSVIFTATIHSSPGTVPNGEGVTFTDGTTVIGTGATASGIATLTTSSLAVGTHTIIATYAGDANFSPSTSATVSETVIKNATTTAVTADLNPSNYGQSVNLLAIVSSPGATPTGTVTFKNGTTAIAQVTLVNGTGSLATATLPVGINSITVAYNGDGSSNGSTSPILSQLVSTAPTTTTIASSLNPSTQGKSVKFTASVTSSNGIPSGTVTFTQGATTLGTATLVAGKANFTTTALPSGTDVITATYNGAANFAGSSATFIQTVT